MRRVVAIIGRPGTGKSAVVRQFLQCAASDWELRELAPLLKAHTSASLNLSVLGDYSDANEIFPGTDRLSMAVAPVALKWMRESTGNVLFEGDRLGNSSTLRLLSLESSVMLRIIHLHAPEWELRRRYMHRGSAQSEKVLQARATKIANLVANPNLRAISLSNPTPAHKDAIVAELLTFFQGKA